MSYYLFEEIKMAKILENLNGRRVIRLSTNDVINIVQEYQNICSSIYKYSDIRKYLDKNEIYLPEDIV